MCVCFVPHAVTFVASTRGIRFFFGAKHMLYIKKIANVAQTRKRCTDTASLPGRAHGRCVRTHVCA